LRLCTFATISVTRLTRMITVQDFEEFISSLLVLVDNGVVQGILVLLQPSGDVVGDRTGIMGNGEMSLPETRLSWFGLKEAASLAQVVGLQLVLEGLISSFREHRLFLKDGEDTHGL